MLRSLKNLSKQAQTVQSTLKIEQRLPSFIQGPCDVHCEFFVVQHPDYYHVSLEICCELSIICQRCLHEFVYPFEHKSELAICFNEDTAERMMTAMDSIVQTADDLNLLDIVTDELHLYCPEKHPNPQDCDQQTSAILNHPPATVG